MWLLFVIAYGLLVLVLLIALLVIVFMLYLVYIRQKYQHIPSPPMDNFVFGHMPMIKRRRKAGKTFSQIMYELSLLHGNVFILWFLHKPVVMVSGTDLTRKVLVTLNLPKSKPSYDVFKSVYGARAIGHGLLTECDHQVWRRKRMLLDPAFHKKCLMNLIPDFNLVCDLFIQKIGRFADTNIAVNFAEEFQRVTMDIIGKVGFNVSLNAVEDKDCPFLQANYLLLKGLQEMFKDMFWKVNFAMYPFQCKAINATKLIRKYGEQVVTERVAAIKEGKDTPNDILQHIIHMTKSIPNLSLDDLVDEFVTFFVAGQETTSNLLAFALYEIENNVDVQKRLIQEVNSVLQGRQHPSYEDLAKFEYLGQTLKESLRLHPPVFGFTRFNKQEVELGGYKIPPETRIRVSVFVENRLQDNWTNPDMFDPDRFSVPNPCGSYFPFSIGPRSCIGKNLAQFEAKIIMARLYQTFEFELISPEGPLVYEEAITLRPKDGVWCKVTKRK